MSNPIARLVVVLAALSLAACTSSTAPAHQDCGGVVAGTGQCH